MFMSGVLWRYALVRVKPGNKVTPMRNEECKIFKQFLSVIYSGINVLKVIDAKSALAFVLSNIFP